MNSQPLTVNYNYIAHQNLLLKTLQNAPLEEYIVLC